MTKQEIISLLQDHNFKSYGDYLDFRDLIEKGSYDAKHELLMEEYRKEKE